MTLIGAKFGGAPEDEPDQVSKPIQQVVSLSVRGFAICCAFVLAGVVVLARASRPQLTYHQMRTELLGSHIRAATAGRQARPLLVSPRQEVELNSVHILEEEGSSRNTADDEA